MILPFPPKKNSYLTIIIIQQQTLLIDHSKKIGEKIRISGGGRCNFTNINASPNKYISNNPRFIISALNQYNQENFIDLVKRYKIKFHEKTYI